jgi:ABC-2 type transport system permease protein
MVRLRRNPIRLLMGLMTPLMFLLILGTGLEAASGASGAALREYRAYLFPGVLLMSVQAPAMAVGVSIVLDRQAGLLRQMLVSPVRRSAIVVGLCLGGATTGAIYGLLVLAVAPFAGIPYHPALLLALAEVLLISLAFTALGMLAAVTIRSVETFQVVMSLCMMPLIFLSGAMFPPGGLPGWLGYAVQANPLTYAVDAVRRTLPEMPEMGGQGLTVAGYTPSVALEVALVTALAVAALVAVTRRFTRPQ